MMTGVRNRVFWRHFLTKKRSIYQDRLGTNIGKLEKEGVSAGDDWDATYLVFSDADIPVWEPGGDGEVRIKIEKLRAPLLLSFKLIRSAVLS